MSTTKAAVTDVDVLTYSEFKHVFQSLKEFWVTLVNPQVNLPEVRGSIHAYFHVNTRSLSFSLLWLQVVFPVGSDWRPPHYLCPVVSNTYQLIIQNSHKTKSFFFDQDLKHKALTSGSPLPLVAKSKGYMNKN